MLQAHRIASLVSTCGRFSAKFGHIREWCGVSGLLFIRKLIINCSGDGCIRSTHSNRISSGFTLLKLNFVSSYSGNNDVIFCGGRRIVVRSVFNCNENIGKISQMARLFVCLVPGSLAQRIQSDRQAFSVDAHLICIGMCLAHFRALSSVLSIQSWCFDSRSNGSQWIYRFLNPYSVPTKK